MAVQRSPLGKRFSFYFFFFFGLIKDEVKSAGTQSLAECCAVDGAVGSAGWWWMMNAVPAASQAAESWGMPEQTKGLTGWHGGLNPKFRLAKFLKNFDAIKRATLMWNFVCCHLQAALYIPPFGPISTHCVYALSSTTLNFNSLDYALKKNEWKSHVRASITVMIAHVRS